MPVYAEPSDLPEGLDDAEDLLLLASALVSEATVTARYKVDSAGLPVAAELRNLFKAATIAQATYWHRLDIDPTEGAAGVTAKRLAASKSIGSASITYESGEAATQARLDALSTLAPAALAILGSLAQGPVIVHG